MTRVDTRVHQDNRAGADSSIDEAAGIGETQSPVILVIEDDQSVNAIVSRVLREES